MPRIKILLRGLISAGLIALVIRKVDWAALAAILSRLDFRWATLASSSTLLLIAGLTLRWRIFLRQQGIDLPYRKVFFLTWAGQFFNSILPGSTGGDVLKVYQICRIAPDRKAAAASTVVIDRLTALVALVVLATGALLIDPAPLAFVPHSSFSTRVLVLAAVGLMMSGAVGLWLLVRLTRGSRLPGQIVRTLAAAKKNLVLNRKLFVAVVLSFGLHLVNFLILFFFARALRIPITYGQVLLMMPVIFFLVLIPVTINGHGLREVLLIAYFGYWGITISGDPSIKVQETAVALSLLAVTNDLLWSLPGGLLYFISFRRQNVSNVEKAAGTSCPLHNGADDDGG